MVTFSILGGVGTAVAPVLVSRAVARGYDSLLGLGRGWGPSGWCGLLALAK